MSQQTTTCWSKLPLDGTINSKQTKVFQKTYFLTTKEKHNRISTILNKLEFLQNITTLYVNKIATEITDDSQTATKKFRTNAKKTKQGK